MPDRYQTEPSTKAVDPDGSMSMRARPHLVRASSASLGRAVMSALHTWAAPLPAR